MKYLFYLPCCFILFSCQNDTTTATNKDSATDTEATPQQSETAYAPGLNTPYKTIADGIWVIEGYIAVSEEEAQQQNVNRWYRFNYDGTYERGRYGEKRGAGNWIYEEDEKILTMEDGEGAFNSQFKIRLSADGQSMIIVGTNRYNQRRIQGKLVKAADYPQK